MLKQFKSLEEMEHYIDSVTGGAFSIFDIKILNREVEKLKSGDNFLEIGVDRGKSYAVAYFSAEEGVNLYAVNIEDTPERINLFKSENFPRDNFTMIDSFRAASTWKKGKIKLIFIDGDHSYETCRLDCYCWYQHMAEGGVMLFHDYNSSSPGVILAVDEFAKDNKLKVEVFYTEDNRSSLAKIQL